MTNQASQTTDASAEQVAGIAQYLTQHDLKLATAESCTGGLLAATLTGIAGSSAWFVGSLVTYQLSAKTRLLGVPADLLAREGAVNGEVAERMATGALERTGADFSIATTGLAGPDGDGTGVPVGTLWVAWASRRPDWCHARHYEFHEPRENFRADAVRVALAGLWEYLQQGAR